MEVAVFSVIFEANLKYIDEFIGSLNNQNCKSFELFLVNDGLDSDVIKKAFEKSDFPIIFHTIKHRVTPAKVREIGFKELAKRNYKKIIFVDTDDLMSPNRIGRSIEMLEKFPIVFTDITLVSENNSLIKSSIWKDRLSNVKVNRDFLYDKNVLGLGNSAMVGSLLEYIKFPENLIAIDWYFFSIMLKDEIAGFIPDAITFYRQHSDNTIGVKNLNYSRLKLILNVKEQHYTEMLNINSNYSKYYDEIQNKKNLLFEESFIVDEINKYNINFFWWEETNFIKYERNKTDKF